MRIAVFPGSFDPFTIGHLDLVQRFCPFFDQVVIAIGVNSKKQYLFPLEQRIKWLETIFENQQNIKITSYTGLTTNFCIAIDISSNQSTIILFGNQFDLKFNCSFFNRFLGNYNFY